jgi:hypothetical protein
MPRELLFFKLFIHSLWPSLIKYKSSFSPSQLAPGVVLVRLLNAPGTLLKGPARSLVFSWLNIYLLVHR